MDVFNPLDSVLKYCVSGSMLENAIVTITKIYTMTIGSKSWREDIQSKTTNIPSKFRMLGMWPLSFPAMQLCLKLFEYSAIKFSNENPIWMRCSNTV